jgi:hypothetical protein
MRVLSKPILRGRGSNKKSISLLDEDVMLDDKLENKINKKNETVLNKQINKIIKSSLLKPIKTHCLLL